VLFLISSCNLLRSSLLYAERRSPISAEYLADFVNPSADMMGLVTRSMGI